MGVLLRNGGREGIRTPGLLIANEGNAKLRRGSAIASVNLIWPLLIASFGPTFW
jgi:hypothetical protein